MIRALTLALLVAPAAEAQVGVPPGLVPQEAPGPLEDPMGLFLHACLGGSTTSERAIRALRRSGMEETRHDFPLSLRGIDGPTPRFSPSDPPREDEPIFEVNVPGSTEGVGVCSVLLMRDGPDVALGRLEPMLRGWAPVHSIAPGTGPNVGDHPTDTWLATTAGGQRFLEVTCPVFPELGFVPEPWPRPALVAIAELPPSAEAPGPPGGPEAGPQVPVGPDRRSELACASIVTEGEPL